MLPSIATQSLQETNANCGLDEYQAHVQIN